MSDGVIQAIETFDSSQFTSVSVERTMAELTKMFKYDTVKTIDLLSWLQDVNHNLYSVVMKGFWLLPTNKKK